jgi:microfibrillar-associated protein 1
MAPPVARPARAAARYRPGKALGGDGGASASGSGSESESEARASSTAAPLSSFAAPQRTAGVVIQSGERPIDLSHVVVGKRAPQPPQAESESEYETDTDEEGPAPQPAARPVFRSAKDRGAAVKEESSEYETDSGEESSEEEAPARVLQKPVFVPK